jgi:hypothetical protein
LHATRRKQVGHTAGHSDLLVLCTTNILSTQLLTLPNHQCNQMRRPAAVARNCFKSFCADSAFISSGRWICTTYITFYFRRLASMDERLSSTYVRGAAAAAGMALGFDWRTPWTPIILPVLWIVRLCMSSPLQIKGLIHGPLTSRMLPLHSPDYYSCAAKTHDQENKLS